MTPFEIILNCIEAVSTIVSVIDSGKIIYTDIKNEQSGKKLAGTDVKSENSVVERALDAVQQEIKNMDCLEVIALEDRQKILHKIQEIHGLDYFEKKELESKLNELIMYINQRISSQMTLEGKLIYNAIKDSDNNRDELLRYIAQQMTSIVEFLRSKTCGKVQKDEYIASVREALKARVPEDYMPRYVGNAKEILGKDEKYLNNTSLLRELLVDIVDCEDQIVLLGQAGAGKTIELENMAYELCMRGIAPVFISLNAYDNETVEELIEQWLHGYMVQDYVLILDGYDEVSNISGFQRKLNSYVQRNPKQKIVISTRNNFYHLSKEKQQGGSFYHFKEYAIFPLLQEDISDYLKKRQINEKEFWRQIREKKLMEQVKVPFYFTALVKVFKRDGCMPELRQLMPQLIAVSMNRDVLKYDPEKELELQEKHILEILQRIGITMQLRKSRKLTENELEQIVTKEENKLIRFSGIWKKMPDGSWQFAHNNFREYVTAQYLIKLSMEQIVDIVTYEKNRGRIKESWYNVLSFVGLLDEKGQMNRWILEHDPSILFRYEDERLTEGEKQKLFLTIFEKINDDYTWISWRTDMDVLVRMAHSKESISYLLNALIRPKHERCQDNAMRLLIQMDDYCGLEDRVRAEFTDMVLDENTKPYIRRLLLEALAIGELYSKQMEEEIFDHLSDITVLPDDVVYGMVMFLHYSQKNNDHVKFLVECYWKSLNRNDSYSVEYMAAELLENLTGYEAIHEFLDTVMTIREEDTDALYHFTECIKRLEEQIKSVYEKENKQILKDTELLFDRAALICEFGIMQVVINFWKKENLVSREHCRIKEQYPNERILLDFESLVYPVCDSESLGKQSEQKEQRKKEELQLYFNALFDKKAFKILVDDFVQIMGQEIKYCEVKWSSVYYSTEREDLRKLAYVFQNVEFKDKKVKNFTEDVDWQSFAINQIYNKIPKSDTHISEQQLTYIKNYVQEQIDQITWEKELRSSKDGDTHVTWRLIYVCNFIVKFHIEVPKEFVLRMIIFPDFFIQKVEEKYSDGKRYRLEKYICEHLSEHEIIIEVRRILKEQSLWGTLASMAIKWCEKYNLDDGKEMAERIFSDKECSESERRESFEYLQKIQCAKDITDRYLETADDIMISILADNASELDYDKLNEKLFGETEKSEGRTKYLKVLFSVLPKRALELYYSIAQEINGIPDYCDDGTIAGTTEQIAELSATEYLVDIIRLLQLCFRDGFRDAQYFGLRESISKALRNIAACDPERVLDELAILGMQTENLRVKGYCNNMILDIEGQYYEQLDTPWSMQKIKQILLNA